MFFLCNVYSLWKCLIRSTLLRFNELCKLWGAGMKEEVKGERDAVENSENLEKFRPLHVSINSRTGGVHAAEASRHVFLKNKVLTNRQWMYIFSESLSSSLELSSWPYMKIVRSRRASKLRRCYYALGLILFRRSAARADTPSCRHGCGHGHRAADFAQSSLIASWIANIRARKTAR